MRDQPTHEDEEADGSTECQECLESFPRGDLTLRPVVGYLCDDCLFADEEDEEEDY